jgi:hypothetical protein
MTRNDADERKPLSEFRGRERIDRNGRGERLRIPPPTRSVLIFVVSVAVCGFLTWWLWARFRIRFYFIFIPLIGIGGPIFGRLRRRPGDGFEGDWRDEASDGETDEKRRLLEDRRDEGADREGGSHPGDRNS